MGLRKRLEAVGLSIGAGVALLAAGCGGGGSSSPPPPSSSSISVSISPASASLTVGDTLQFNATVTGTSNTAATWSVNSVVGGNSTVGTISTTGLYTAPNTPPSPNTVTVTASSQADNSKSAAATVTINARGPLSLSFLDPIVTTQNSGAFTLNVNGSGFGPDSQVSFNGVAKPTTFVSSTKLTAQISTSDIASPGTFPVKVQSGGSSSGTLNFFVVPSIASETVSVSAGGSTGGINIAVPGITPTLSLVAVGTGRRAGVTGVSVRQGASVGLFIVGKGVVPGTFFAVSGKPGDVTVMQPLAAAFSQTTDGIPAVNLSISVSPSAALGARNILVTNPAGEISVFVGGLLITQ